jgi:hypothetical protein
MDPTVLFYLLSCNIHTSINYTMASQNIYDDAHFFELYSEYPRAKEGDLRCHSCYAVPEGRIRETCYGCTASDHDAYHCVKLKTLSNHGLFYAVKLEGTSMILGTLDDAQNGLS